MRTFMSLAAEMLALSLLWAALFFLVLVAP